MAPTYIRTQIRIPQELYDQLQKAAESSARSFNAEMLVRLESSFRHGITPERTPVAGQNAVYLRPFQQWLMECVRKIVRIEALLGAPELTREQQEELSRLKEELEQAMASPADYAGAIKGEPAF